MYLPINVFNIPIILPHYHTIYGHIVLRFVRHCCYKILYKHIARIPTHSSVWPLYQFVLQKVDYLRSLNILYLILMLCSVIAIYKRMYYVRSMCSKIQMVINKFTIFFLQYLLCINGDKL